MTLSLFADTSGPMEAVVYGWLSGGGGCFVSLSLAAGGSSQEVKFC